MYNVKLFITSERPQNSNIYFLQRTHTHTHTTQNCAGKLHKQTFWDKKRE